MPKRKREHFLFLQLKLPATCEDSIYRMRLRANGFRVVYSYRTDIGPGYIFDTFDSILSFFKGTVSIYHLHKAIRYRLEIQGVVLELL